MTVKELKKILEICIKSKEGLSDSSEVWISASGGSAVEVQQTSILKTEPPVANKCHDLLLLGGDK